MNLDDFKEDFYVCIDSGSFEAFKGCMESRVDIPGRS